jgi:uncharacterized protein
MSAEAVPVGAEPLAPVVHNAAQSRFEMVLGNETAVCDYRMDGATMVLPHTWVPPAQEGRGIAAAMVAAALDHARRGGMRVLPLCSYVARYMRRHPENQDLIATA